LVRFSSAQYADSDYTDVLNNLRGIAVLIANTDPENTRFDSSGSDESDDHERRGLTADYDDDYNAPHAAELHFDDFGDDIRYGIVAGGNYPDADYDDYDSARSVDLNDF
ncbi:hypothetical protein AAVH_31921, partial [Aphelenchoides avenae]